MAKFGEGDPRWLVRERQDGRNVGAWHWEEKNITKGASDRLKGILTNLQLLEVTECKTTEVSKCNGEIAVCRRKGKTFFIYDLEVNIKWEGKLGDTKCKGEISIPSFCIDEPVPETKIKVTTSTKGEDAEVMLELVKSDGVRSLRATLTSFFDILHAEFVPSVEIPKEPTFASTEGIKLDPNNPDAIVSPEIPKASSGGSSSSSSSPSTSPAVSSSAVPSSSSSSSPSSSSKTKLSTKTINQKVNFEAPATELFKCFTDASRLQFITGSAAVLTKEVGGTFSLFGGHIQGSFKEIVEDKKIVQQWRSQKWPEGHYSVLTLTFEEDKSSSSSSNIILKQTGVPSDDYDCTFEGWGKFFWVGIRGAMGYRYKVL